jgi:WD repeat-containing protein 59
LYQSAQKGSLPISHIKAHNAKIYGIDWSHERRNEIVTCSLDKTIKVWDVHASAPEEQGDGWGQNTMIHVPKRIIETNYPVWRARDLPFGRGLLSLPQRGETALEMFAYGDEEAMPNSVQTFEGHTDVVKEFVWRKGGRGELLTLVPVWEVFGC